MNSVSLNFCYLLILILLPVLVSAEEGFQLLATMSGENEGDSFSEVCGLGDINGDNCDDFGIIQYEYTDVYSSSTKIKWNVTNYSIGVYFMRMTAGKDFTTTGKMLLIK